MSDRRESSDSESGLDSDDVYQATYDWSSTPPSTGVVEAVADAANREATALEPMYETIDPDALDQLLRSGNERETDGNIAVSFEYAGYDVTTSGDGTILVRVSTAESRTA